jgi:Ion channel
MHIASATIGIFTVVLVLLDAFETIVLPRRIRKEFRLSRVFYRRTWLPWRRIAGHIAAPGRRENFLGYFGPLSLIFLLALWACGLIFGFTLLQYGAGDHVQLNGQPVTFYALIYHSGETFFTLGYGDIVPTSALARFLAVLEAGMGFGFLGTVIGYIPTIYSSFSRREIEISMLDERAGSPSTASELLSRMGKSTQQDVLDGVFRDWERWAAEVLESHLSYPALSFFRSQHNNQSWLGALTTVLDASSLVIAGVDGLRSDQAKLTYAIARHAVVDLSQVVNARYDANFPDRLPDEQMVQLRKTLLDRGVKLGEGAQFEQKLSYLRSLYEPYSQSIARNLLITLPPWIHDEKKKDNWQAGPWDRIIQARGLAILGQKIKLIPEIDDHF